MSSRISPHEHTPTAPIAEVRINDQAKDNANAPLICWVLLAIAFGLLLAAGRGWLSN